MTVERPTIRATEWTLLSLAVLAAVATIALRPGEAGFQAGTATAFIIVVLTSVHMWARRTGVMWSSRYLALFTVVLAAWMAMSGFVLRLGAAYAWTMAVLGGLIAIVATYEAIRSQPSREGQRPLDPKTNV